MAVGSGSVGRTVEAAPVAGGGEWLTVGGVEAGGSSGCLPGGAGCEVDVVPALGRAPLAEWALAAVVA
jgi:hypothetical protein